jgi:hypothetical protein
LGNGKFMSLFLKRFKNVKNISSDNFLMTYCLTDDNRCFFNSDIDILNQCYDWIPDNENEADNDNDDGDEGENIIENTDSVIEKFHTFDEDTRVNYLCENLMKSGNYEYLLFTGYNIKNMKNVISHLSNHNK